ncbi:MAG: hypothetical protein ACLQBX_10785, partial [Candidatus Limnocylindrales bacterium]
MRRLATPLVLLALALALLGAAIAAPAPAIVSASTILADGQLTLRLTSTTPGATFSGNTLVCPPVLITS